MLRVHREMLKCLPLAEGVEEVGQTEFVQLSFRYAALEATLIQHRPEF